MIKDYREILLLIDSIILFHDPNSNGHGLRTSKLARKLATIMGLSKSTVENVTFAMHVHDIGKIGIAESILNKITKLTVAERAMIKSHSMSGVEVLRPLKLHQGIYEIVAQVHENWNGSGYPLGLKEDKICIGAQIGRVVDYYDAMTNFRIYREIFSTQHALEEIEKDNGISVNPAVFKAFESMILMEYSI